MAKLFKDDPRVRFFIGDVRDKDRLHRALNNIDFVVHAAATKIVPTAEYNPFECIKTNIIGAQNVIHSAMENSVKKVVLLSTDKAVYPINAMGMTKALMEKLMVHLQLKELRLMQDATLKVMLLVKAYQSKRVQI